jgi:hypothetical protein
MRKKLLITIACLSCILCIMVTGTIAWLTDETGTVTNTFTPSKIDIDLVETTGGEYQMIPGKSYTKDPTVKVAASSEACYVFVQVVEDLGSWTATGKTFADYMTYSVAGANGWIALDGAEGVYYQKLDAVTAAAGTTIPVLNGNTIAVKGTVNKTDMDKLYANNATNPTLKFTAYAIQSEYLDYGVATTENAKALVPWNTIKNPN